MKFSKSFISGNKFNPKVEVLVRNCETGSRASFPRVIMRKLQRFQSWEMHWKPNQLYGLRSINEVTKDSFRSANQKSFQILLFPSMFASNPGTYYLELQSNRDYSVGDSYFDYLATSLNYRSDLVRVVARLQQFFSLLTQKRSRSWRSDKEKWLQSDIRTI